jgi:hypothetical protein
MADQNKGQSPQRGSQPGMPEQQSQQPDRERRSATGSDQYGAGTSAAGQQRQQGDQMSQPGQGTHHKRQKGQKGDQRR